MKPHLGTFTNELFGSGAGRLPSPTSLYGFTASVVSRVVSFHATRTETKEMSSCQASRAPASLLTSPQSSPLPLVALNNIRDEHAAVVGSLMVALGDRHADNRRGCSGGQSRVSA